MNNERCDIEKEASKREFAKVIASLQEQWRCGQNLGPTKS